MGTYPMTDTRYRVSYRAPAPGNEYGDSLCSVAELEPCIARLLSNGYTVLGVEAAR